MENADPAPGKAYPNKNAEAAARRGGANFLKLICAAPAQ